MTLRKGGIGNVLALMAIVGIIVAALVLMLNTLTQQQRIGQITTESVQRQVTTFELRQRLSACVVNGQYNNENAIGLKVSDVATFCNYAQGVQLTLNYNGNVYTIFVPSDVIKASPNTAKLVKITNDLYINVTYDACTNDMKTVPFQASYGIFKYQIPAAVVFEAVDSNGNVVDAKVISAQILVKGIGWIPAPNCFQQMLVPINITSIKTTVPPTGFNAINNTYVINVYSLQKISAAELKATLCPDGELYLLEPHWNGTRNNVPISVLVSDADVGFNATSAMFYELMQLPNDEQDYYLVRPLPWSVTKINGTARVFTTVLDSPVPLAKGSGAKVLVAMCLPYTSNVQLKPVELPLNFQCYTPADKTLELDLCYAGPVSKYLATGVKLNITANETKVVTFEGLQYPVDSTFNRTVVMNETYVTIPGSGTVEIPENVAKNTELVIRYNNVEKTIDISKSKYVRIVLQGGDRGNIEISAKNPNALTEVYLELVLQGVNADNVEILKNVKYFKGAIGLTIQGSEINGNVEILTNAEVAVAGKKDVVSVLLQGTSLKGNLIVLENPSVAGNVYVTVQGREIDGNVQVMKNTKTYVAKSFKLFLEGTTVKGNVEVLTNADTVRAGGVKVVKHKFCCMKIVVKKASYLTVEVQGGEVKGNVEVMKNVNTFCGAAKVILFGTTVDGNVAVLTNAHIKGYVNVNTFGSYIEGSLSDVFKNACACENSVVVLNDEAIELPACQDGCSCTGPVTKLVSITTLTPPRNGELVYVAKGSYLDPRMFECCSWKKASSVTVDLMGVEATLYPGKYGELINDTTKDIPFNGTVPNATFVAPIWQNSEVNVAQLDTDKVGLVYEGFWRLYNVGNETLAAINEYGDVVSTYLAVPKLDQYFVGLSNGTSVVPLVKNMLNVTSSDELNGLTVIMVNKDHFYVTMRQVSQ